MAANIVSPAQSGRFYMAAPPGCWRARRSYSGFQPRPAGGRQIWCVSTTPCRMLCDSGWRVSRIFRWWPTPPNAVGLRAGLCHPGHSKLPIVARAVHNQPSPREMVDWILRSWVLQFGFLVIIFWRFAFMGKLSSDRLMQIVGIFNDVCYLATLVLAGILLRDGWRDFQGVAAPAGNIRIPLIFALSFYLPFQLVWILLSAQQYELPLWGWLLLIPAMVGVLLARGDGRDSAVFPALAGDAGLSALARTAGLI